ncbi:MAG: DUF1501 domain-containing protein [Bacteroidota bacterium]
MCSTHDSPAASRTGRRLEDGAAHGQDHARWSRRRFLGTLGLGAASLGGMSAWGMPSVLAGWGPNGALLPDGDTILVLLQLDGGNDGLNTVIPFRDDIYQRNRPTLGFRRNEVLSLTDDLGLHPALAPLHRRYQDGHMAIVQHVGYENASRSHFRGTDIWVSASGADQTLNSGWPGRTLETSYPDLTQHTAPLGVQVRGERRLFRGTTGGTGVSFSSPETLERLVEGGARYDPDAAPATTYGAEIAYVRTLANQSFRYGEALQRALDAGANRVSYPEHGEYDLGEQLALVARLIRGGLGARIYAAAIDGFDTHIAQADQHETLLGVIATSVDAFLSDLEADGLADRVVVMTFSEFGRTLAENGAQGTDHGVAAPQFLIGPRVQGGVLGGPPDLTDLDPFGDLRHRYDFRQIYASVLTDWYGMPASDTTSVLGQAFQTLPLFSGSVDTTMGPAVPATALFAPYPSPTRGAMTVPFHLASAQQVRLTAVDLRGRTVRVLFEGRREAGRHTLQVTLDNVASGTYVLRFEAQDGTRQARPVTVVR